MATIYVTVWLRCYSKRKINDFLSMINGLQTAIKITSILNNIDDDHSLHDRYCMCTSLDVTIAL